MPVTCDKSAGRLMKIELKDDGSAASRKRKAETSVHGQRVRDRLSPTVSLAIKGRSYTS